MMAQSTQTFVAELKNCGIVIPPETTEIHIKLSWEQPALIWFKVVDIGSLVVQKYKGSFLYEISSSEFFNKLKKVMNLPESTSEVHIEAKVDSIVMCNIQAALPEGSLGFLKAE